MAYSWKGLDYIFIQQIVYFTNIQNKNATIMSIQIYTIHIIRGKEMKRSEFYAATESNKKEQIL